MCSTWNIFVFMEDKHVYLKLKDYSVSGEKFELQYNANLDLLETKPQPSPKQLPNYYKSEDYISHTNAKRNLFENAYHFVRHIALKRKLKLINDLQPDTKHLLDVGCGTGEFIQLAQKNKWVVKGIEPNTNARTIANKKTGDSVFDTNMLLKLKTGSFDVITLWHVLEHLPNLDQHISVFKKLLKPNGTLIIAVPNYRSYDANYYKNFWAAYDVPRHLWHFSRTSITKLMNSKQLEVIKVRPMIFDAYYVSLLSEKYKFGRMRFLNAFKIGFRSNKRAKHSGEYSSLIYCVKNQFQ